jgi:hypothetical protein
VFVGNTLIVGFDRVGRSASQPLLMDRGSLVYR